MATIRLPADFRDFLKLLNSHRVEYLLVGGYAVCYHGYYRNTGDMDLWIAVHRENASKMVPLIREFGFDVPELSEALFLQKGRIIRMGIEPVRIDPDGNLPAANSPTAIRKRWKQLWTGFL